MLLFARTCIRSFSSLISANQPNGRILPFVSSCASSTTFLIKEAGWKFYYSKTSPNEVLVISMRSKRLYHQSVKKDMWGVSKCWLVYIYTLYLQHHCGIKDLVCGASHFSRTEHMLLLLCEHMLLLLCQTLSRANMNKLVRQIDPSLWWYSLNIIDWMAV